MTSPEGNSVLVLHGLPSKHLPGIGIPSMLVLSAMFCFSLPFWLQGILRALLGFHLRYVVAAAIVLIGRCPVIWRWRWPVISSDSVGTWQLHISVKGFACRASASQLTWLAWPADSRVSFRRVRPDFYRVRILRAERSMLLPYVVVDLLVACDDQQAEEVAGYIQACREGRQAEVPALESASQAARSVACQAPNTDVAGHDTRWFWSTARSAPMT